MAQQAQASSQKLGQEDQQHKMALMQQIHDMQQPKG
jgi:hypothetical protein